LEIERVLRSDKYCFYDEVHGGLWVGRAYRRGGASNRDPLFNISHGATARQAARFYAMLDAGRLVTKHWSFRMLGLMSPPKHFHKFVGGLSGESGVVFLARKSGTWRTSHADSALIQHHGNRYVAIGMADLKNGEAVMRDLIRVVDSVVVDGKYRRRTKKKPFRQVRRQR
jgi:beta-lactamase class A